MNDARAPLGRRDATGSPAIATSSAASHDFDAVHLTVLGHLDTATRRPDVDQTTATLLAGRDPNQTWWLTDLLNVEGPGRDWHTDQESDDVLGGWHATPT